MERLKVGRYELRLGRHYDPESHLWLEVSAGGLAICGFDPLGSETAGDIVALSFDPPGTRVARGESFGTLEAAKFVGPLRSPISGEIVAHNDSVLRHPGVIGDDPLEHWLVEMRLEDPSELGALISAPERLRTWFESEVARFRREGSLAE